MKSINHTSTRQLSSEVGLKLTYDDETAFGSAVSGRCERELQKRFAVLYAYRQKHGLARLVRESRDVLGRVLPRWLDDIREAPDRLRDSWLYPEPTCVKPRLLSVVKNLSDVMSSIPINDTLTAELALWLGEWQQGAKPPVQPHARQLWDALVEAGALVSDNGHTTIERRPGVHYVGHATLRIDDGDHHLIIDPFLFPKSSLYADDWQPETLSDMGQPDAILITHSHPDHYDLGTLLRSGADTAIYVPVVRRESVLAIDMVARLQQLGFRNVHGVEEWSEFQVGSMRIQALPFYGEQPTTGEQLHPEVRNQGAAYLVEIAGQKFVALADAGRDSTGDVRDLAARANNKFGSVDTVFGGYRGFALYPVQFAFSSVSSYLPFVPPSSWGERQQIMCDADDLIDVAERWGAKSLVPYAAGGAPWYWMRGLGPCLEDSVEDATSTDPPPEHVVAVAQRRVVNRTEGAIASPVNVETMKVGTRLELTRSD